MKMKYPQEIYLDGYTCTQMYDQSEEQSDVITGSFISLYLDGKFTYLWN